MLCSCWFCFCSSWFCFFSSSRAFLVSDLCSSNLACWLTTCSDSALKDAAAFSSKQLSSRCEEGTARTFAHACQTYITIVTLYMHIWLYQCTSFLNVNHSGLLNTLCFENTESANTSHIGLPHSRGDAQSTKNILRRMKSVKLALQ